MGRDRKKYKVIFLGPAAKDFTLVDKLVKNLQTHFRLSAQNVTKMMRLAPITVKSGIEMPEAQKYKAALENIGGDVRIEPTQDSKGERTKTKTLEASNPWNKEAQRIPIKWGPKFDGLT